MPEITHTIFNKPRASMLTPFEKNEVEQVISLYDYYINLKIEIPRDFFNPKIFPQIFESADNILDIRKNLKDLENLERKKQLMSNRELAEQEEEIKLLFYFLLINYQFSLAQGQQKEEKLKELAYCRKVLENWPNRDATTQLESEAMPLALFGFTFGQAFVADLRNFFKGKAARFGSYEQVPNELANDNEVDSPHYSIFFQKLKQKKASKILLKVIEAGNQNRLHWVWSSMFLNGLISLLPQDLQQLPAEGFGGIANTTTTLSYSIYFFRLALNLGFMIWNTANPTVENKQFSWTKRLKNEFEERKYEIGNDVAWGGINLLTARWFLGTGLKGNIGNSMVGVLFLWDLFLTWMQYRETREKLFAQIKQFQTEIEILKEKQSELKSRLAQSDDEEIKNQLKFLEAQIKKFEYERDQRFSDVQMETRQALNALCYGVGLIIGITLNTSFYFPPSFILPHTGLILGCVGGAICLALTLALEWQQKNAEINNSLKKLGKAEERIKALITEFREEQDSERKKDIYLEVESLRLESTFQQKMAQYYRLERNCALITRGLIPALTFGLSFVFPFAGPSMLGIIALGFAISSMVSLFLKSKKPTLKEKKPVISDENFKNFEFFVNIKDDNEEIIKALKEEDIPNRGGWKETPKIIDNYDFCAPQE